MFFEITSVLRQMYHPVVYRYLFILSVSPTRYIILVYIKIIYSRYSHAARFEWWAELSVGGVGGECGGYGNRVFPDEGIATPRHRYSLRG